MNHLGDDPVGKLVLRLALPSMLAQFVNVLYGIVDRMYIGNIAEVGGVALAGVGVCGPIVTLISSFAILIGIGGSPLVAMRLGENNQKGAQEILANCFALLTGIALFLTVFFTAVKKPMLMWFGASESTFAYANDYLSVVIMGSVFSLLATGLNQFIICQGFSTIGMATVLIGAVLNIALDPLFIFVFQMGVRGAALATVLSQMASCIFVLLFLCGGRARVRITLEGYSFRIMRRVLAFGFSPFIIIATDSVIIIALNTVLQTYGGPDHGDMLITCATIVQSYMQLITMPLAGITGGTQPILSFNFGAKQTARIKEAFGKITKLALLFSGIMLLISQLLPRFFVLIFTRTPATIQLSVWGIRVFTMGVLILALQYVFVDGLTALGIAKVAAALSLNRKVLFLLLTLVLPRFFGATSAFFAEPIVDILCGLISTLIFCLLINKVLKKREEMPDDQALYR